MGWCVEQGRGRGGGKDGVERTRGGVKERDLCSA